LNRLSERNAENSLAVLEDTVRMLTTLLEEEKKKNLGIIVVVIF